MRTTLDISEELVRAVMKVSRVKTKKSAIELALQEYLRSRKRQELKEMIGHYDEFDLTLQRLDRMRREH